MAVFNCHVCGNDFERFGRVSTSSAKYCSNRCKTAAYHQPAIILKRFWSHVKRTETCWLWQGAINNHGYGEFHANGIDWYSHRFSYQSSVGTIAEGLWVLHKCDTPSCVRPDH